MAKSNGKPPTMRDVAELAGVSQPTVSRVLNNKNSTIPVSEDTRAKVFAAIKELGYHPNTTARSLRTQCTQMIAVMIADLSNAFYHPIARAAHDIAQQYHYDVLIANSDHKLENEQHFCEAVVRRPVDGIIMVPIHLTDEDIDRLIGLTQIPVVVLGKQIKHPDVDVVWVNDQQAVYDAITWLIQERSHTEIGFLGVPDALPPGPRRWQGFKNALDDAGLSINPAHLFEGDFSVEAGRIAARKLLTQSAWPSAVFALNDLMAMGFILELQDAGYTIPEDIAVMGFDDIPEAQIIRPNLTTIAQYPYDLGHIMATALFDRIEGDISATKRLFEGNCSLIVRDSA